MLKSDVPWLVLFSSALVQISLLLQVGRTRMSFKRRKRSQTWVSTNELWGSRGNSVLGCSVFIKSMPWWQQHQDSPVERQSYLISPFPVSWKVSRGIQWDLRQGTVKQWRPKNLLLTITFFMVLAFLLCFLFCFFTLQDSSFFTVKYGWSQIWMLTPVFLKSTGYVPLVKCRKAEEVKDLTKTRSK